MPRLFRRRVASGKMAVLFLWLPEVLISWPSHPAHTHIAISSLDSAGEMVQP